MQLDPQNQVFNNEAPARFNKKVSDRRFEALPNVGKVATYDSIEVRVGDSIKFSSDNDGPSYGFIIDIVGEILKVFIWLRASSLFDGPIDEVAQTSYNVDVELFEIDEKIDVVHELEFCGKGYYFNSFYEATRNRIYSIESLKPSERISKLAELYPQNQFPKFDLQCEVKDDQVKNFFQKRSISVGGVNCFDLYPFTFFDFSTLVANSNGKFSRNGAIYKVTYENPEDVPEKLLSNGWSSFTSWDDDILKIEGPVNVQYTLTKNSKNKNKNKEKNKFKIRIGFRGISKYSPSMFLRWSTLNKNANVIVPKIRSSCQDTDDEDN